MPKTRMNCPNCRQPIVVEIDQVFDVAQDPTTKQRFLSGAFNIAECPHCGYQGMVATPVIYHDPVKELLLTYFPPELGMTVNEQERMVGPQITTITNNLPQEKRKAYLLRPQTMLTLQSMVERVLEADGITREMIQAQQKRLTLLQQLMSANDESLAEIAAKEDATLDGDFYTILNRLVETAMANGDEAAAQRLNEVQQKLLPLTTTGRQIMEQTQEVEAAIRSLQEAGKDLTREKLLNLVIDAPNDTRLSVIVSLTRQGMDYAFFQLLSERIDGAQGEERERLTARRERLLEFTRTVDQQMEARTMRARQILDALMQSGNPKEALAQNLHVVDEFFLQVLQEDMEKARKAADLEKIAKLQQMQEVLEQANEQPPELALIEEFLQAEDKSALEQAMEAHRDEITPEFVELLTSLVARPQEDQDPELLRRLQAIHQVALRMSMRANRG